jgi:hypothetical protein
VYATINGDYHIAVGCQFQTKCAAAIFVRLLRSFLFFVEKNLTRQVENRDLMVHFPAAIRGRADMPIL